MRNTYVKISLDTIKKNTEIIKEICGDTVAVCAVIKADAYGHGMVPVAEVLSNTADYFAVAIVQEGKTLRENGVKLPILVLAGIDEHEAEEALKYDLTLTVPSLDKLEMVQKVGRHMNIIPKIHLKIDTGMGRLGVNWKRAQKFIDRTKELNENGEIICEGIYSHFADSMDPDYTKLQYERFITVIDYAKENNFNPKYLHICSSRSIFLYPEYRMTMVRPGIALYGIEPECNEPILPKEIKPALEWKTHVSYFKVLELGEPVGYGRVYSVENEYERIVTLPLGYADGLPRRLSNNGEVIIGGKKYPIVGRVCMDQVMVSLGNTGEAYVGDQVTIIGTDCDSTISAVDIAKAIDTTPHEITTCISVRVPRIYEE